MSKPNWLDLKVSIGTIATLVFAAGGFYTAFVFLSERVQAGEDIGAQLISRVSALEIREAKGAQQTNDIERRLERMEGKIDKLLDR